MGNTTVEDVLAAVDAGRDVRDVVRGLDLATVASLMRDVNDGLDRAAATKTKLQKAFDALRMTVVPEMMDAMQLKSANIDGIGRITLTSDAFVSTPAAKQDELKAWLTDHGLDDMIKETVNSSTLKAWAIRRVKAGEEVPDCISVTPYSRASITSVS